MTRVRNYSATATHGAFHVTTTVYDWVPIETDCSAIAGNDSPRAPAMKNARPATYLACTPTYC
jgi:hypothetical protein